VIDTVSCSSIFTRLWGDMREFLDTMLQGDPADRLKFRSTVYNCGKLRIKPEHARAFCSEADYDCESEDQIKEAYRLWKKANRGRKF